MSLCSDCAFCFRKWDKLPYFNASVFTPASASAATAAAAPESPRSPSSSSSLHPSPSAASETQNEYLTLRKESDYSLANSITWQFPSSSDVFGFGDTIIEMFSIIRTDKDMLYVPAFDVTVGQTAVPHVLSVDPVSVPASADM